MAGHLEFQDPGKGSIKNHLGTGRETYYTVALFLTFHLLSPIFPTILGHLDFSLGESNVTRLGYLLSWSGFEPSSASYLFPAFLCYITLPPWGSFSPSVMPHHPHQKDLECFLKSSFLGTPRPAGSISLAEPRNLYLMGSPGDFYSRPSLSIII